MDQSTPDKLVIGSRRSRLAMIQTHIVIDSLKKYYPKCQFQIKNIDTIGDNILDKPLAKIGEKSLFTRELEDELLQGNIDMIVHSLKDLPTTLPNRCCVGAIMKREDPSDSLVLRKDLMNSIQLKPNIENKLEFILQTKQVQTFGTSSLRRIAQLRNHSLSLSVDIVIKDVRGNLNTRLNKLDDHEKHGFDCLILATAGLIRANFTDRISLKLDNDDWYHAVSQGALGIECLADDDRILSILRPLIDMHSVFECTSERVLMKRLEGGCSVPIGVKTMWKNKTNDYILTLKARVLSVDGCQSIQNEHTLNLDEEHDSDHYDNMNLDFTDIKIDENDPRFECRLRNSVILGQIVAKNLLEMGVKNILHQNC